MKARDKIIISIIFLVVIGLFSYLFFYESSTPLTPREGEQFINPELNFGMSNKWFTYLSEQENPDFIESNGYYIYGPVDGDYGIIILHPISKNLPRYLGTYINLNNTNKNYTLQIKVANIAGKVSFANSSNCNDNIFEIYLSDIFSSGDVILIDRITANSKDGWIYKEYNLNGYRGNWYYLEILSTAGGPCGNWNGEWGAIGYLNIKEV